MHTRNNSAWETIERNPTIRKIVDYIDYRERCEKETYYSDIMRRFKLKNGTTAHYMSLMKRNDIVISETDGRKKNIRLSRNFKADRAKEEREKAIPKAESEPKKYRLLDLYYTPTFAD